MFPRKTTLTIGTFVVLAAVMPHGVRPAQLVSTLTLVRPIAAPVPVAPTLKEQVLKQPVPTQPSAAIPDLDVPPGSLDAFYASLRGKGVTRILHYGDSPTTADLITSDIRRLLQAEFGDAGHGFVLVAKPWAWYGHNGIKLDAKGWQIEPASQKRAPDGFHGLGGVSFRGETGAFSRVGLPDPQYTAVIVYYLSQPGGGTFTVNAGGAKIEDAKIGEVNTAADEKTPGFTELRLPPGTTTIELRVSDGKVRLFGYRFDKDHPGVQYSSIGINGGQVQMVLRYFEVNQWTEALRHENPALVVLNYGANESIYPAYVQQQYPDELRQVIARIRKALPNASLLLMGPMDRGTMDSSGQIVTPESLQTLIEVQKKVAAETGCAFFNTFHAMGGAGTMGRWYHAEPRLVSADFMHPLPAGAAQVGALFEGALVQSYRSAQ
ncbi:MAG TPA: GDSL-type esterase/lipase family protein [Bryobacteraceae bacterium]|jgi:lysophospholipase L1-like esterase|nr:GDSL-type esterase/lipase family protein [Bryobacteraceae bacterium]